MICKNYIQMYKEPYPCKNLILGKEKLSKLPLMPDPNSAFGHSPSLSLDMAIVEYSPLSLSLCQGWDRTASQTAGGRTASLWGTGLG